MKIAEPAQRAERAVSRRGRPRPVRLDLIRHMKITESSASRPVRLDLIRHMKITESSASRPVRLDRIRMR